jgi:type VI secretion system ImpC/EvpB family protein
MGRLTFDLQMPRGRTTARGDGAVTRVLVLADLSGSARDDARDALASARLTRIDVESFDDALRSLQPRAAIPAATPRGAEQILTFVSLDDFHPDALYESLDSIVELRRTRERLASSATFAAEQARLLADVAPASTGSPVTAEAEDDAATFARLLGRKPAASSPSRAAAPVATPKRASSIDQLLRELVAPHIVRGPGAEQAQLLGSVDAAISDEMRRVLHAPSFQRLEALWRGLRTLVFENPLGPDLEVFLLDASRAELIADLRACGGELERSQLYRLLVQPSAGLGGVRFSLVLSDWTIHGTDEDVSLLAGLGAVAARAGACLLAAADSSLWGARDLATQRERGAWSEPDPATLARMALVRGSAVAPFIGLCGPRILGRVPYGPKTDPIERFAFTELTNEPAHGDFLWTNPAFACAQLILSGVAEDGWENGPGTVLDLGDLPHVMVRARGDDAHQACAEVFLDEISAQRILNTGVMPFLSYRNRNAVRLLRLQSIADPPVPLALRGSH